MNILRYLVSRFRPTRYLAHYEIGRLFAGCSVFTARNDTDAFRQAAQSAHSQGRLVSLEPLAKGKLPGVTSAMLDAAQITEVTDPKDYIIHPISRVRDSYDDGRLGRIMLLDPTSTPLDEHVAYNHGFADGITEHAATYQDRNRDLRLERSILYAAEQHFTI